MNNKHKAMSLLMASVIGATTIPNVTETLVHASTIKQATGMSIVKTTARYSGKLSKGDSFDVSVYVQTDIPQVTEGDVLGLDRTEVTALKGASGSNLDVRWTQYQDPQLGIIQVADIKGLSFKGDSSSIELELWHPSIGGDNALTTSVALDTNSIELNASSSEAIKIVQNTVNVVAGETQQIRLTLENKLSVASEKGTLKLSITDKNIAKKIQLKTKEIDIPEMRPGEKKDITINLDITEDLPRGFYELNADIGGTSQIVKLKSDSNFMPPALEVNLQSTQPFELNKPQNVTLDIKNVGHVSAKNVTATLTGDSVVVANGSNKKHVENIDSNKTVNLPVSLMITDNSKAVVPLTVEFKYIDDEGKEHTSSHILNIPTRGTTSQKEITVTTTKEPTGTIKPGQQFDVAFNVVAPDGVKDLKISVEPSNSIIPKTKNLFIEPALNKGQQKEYNVSFVALDDISTGTHSIAITASYKLNGESIEAKSYATVYIDNQKKDDDDNTDSTTGQPKVIIGTYSTNPRVVKAGEEFTLDIEFVNTHASQSVSNLKANLSVNEKGENDTGSVFTPVNSSNTFFISKLAPGQSVKKSITMYTLPNAKPKTYEVTFDMSYDDSKGNAVKESEFIGIPVAQVTRLEVAEVSVESTEVGGEADMTATIYNTGKTDISNIMIKLEGSGFSAQESTLFQGLFEKGSNIQYTPSIIPQMEGTLHGEIVITYEEVSGEQQELREPFSFDVFPAMVYPEIGVDNIIDNNEVLIPSENPSSDKGMFVAIGAAVLGAIGVGTTIILKKRKKKQQEDEMMDDED